MQAGECVQHERRKMRVRAPTGVDGDLAAHPAAHRVVVDEIGSERRDGEHRQHDRIQPEPGAPASLVAKFPGASEMGRHIGNLFDFYNREIRFYEEIDLLPSPKRKPNGYREYSEPDVDRLKLVAGARRLDLTLEDIKEILDLRDRQLAPCSVLLDLLDRKANEIHRR